MSKCVLEKKRMPQQMSLGHVRCYDDSNHCLTRKLMFGSFAYIFKINCTSTHLSLSLSKSPTNFPWTHDRTMYSEIFDWWFKLFASWIHFNHLDKKNAFTSIKLSSSRRSALHVRMMFFFRYLASFAAKLREWRWRHYYCSFPSRAAYGFTHITYIK